ncbi:MAG: hypothetical protein IJA36_03820 [Lachnospiraceae bacterium]|nr:hypothetical protein [Lachnospiraceae bacterium]
MLNEDKIKVMTKLATYEQGEGKETLPIMQYFQGDYIIFNLIKAVISVTVAYVIIIATLCLIKGQYLMDNIHKMSIEQLGGRILFGYIVFLAVYITAALIVYYRRYVNAKNSVRRYYNQLKKLNSYYKEERDR